MVRFFRPDNEDVTPICLIDGSCIAVSSLTHEIYKGDNIRAIVDRMSICTMLLPQKKMGAKLLLHSTAAISAFLAACEHRWG